MKPFLINIVPFKRRTKTAICNGHVRVYTPRESQIEEELIAKAYKGPCYEGPVSLRIHIFRQMPKSRPKKQTSEPDVYKPDIDNIIKAIMDGLNGVAYKDDCQVVAICAVKHDRKPKEKRPQEQVVVWVDPLKTE